MFQQVVNSQSRFLQRVAEASKLYDAPYNYAALPTYIFLLSLFVLLHCHILRNTSSYTRLNIKIQRNIKLHWIYFNSTRFWYIFMSYFRKVLWKFENYVQGDMDEDDRLFLTMTTRVAFLVVLVSLAMVPPLLIYANYVYKNDMPNFLLWAVEDPWVRHEIGISGHCLERPLRAEPLRLKYYSYRTKRSVSYDKNLLFRIPKTFRNCHSVIERSVVRSLDDMCS